MIGRTTARAVALGVAIACLGTLARIAAAQTAGAERTTGAETTAGAEQGAAEGQGAVTESVERLAGPQGDLVGTLLLAGGEGSDAAPVVLILPGSGPTDRDGNSPVGIAAATYRLLAEGLAERGISSLRVDKRGLFDSAGAVASADAVVVPDYIEDVRGWLGRIDERTGTSCTVLLGHSEGALVALAAASDLAGDDALCALVLLSSPGRPLGDILREQLRANPALAPLLERASATIDELEAGRRVEGADLPPELAPLFRPPVQDFLISLLALEDRKSVV